MSSLKIKKKLITDLKFRVKVGKVGGLESQNIAELPVQGQDWFERDSVAILVEYLRGDGRVWRNTSAGQHRLIRVHVSRHLILFFFFFFSKQILFFPAGKKITSQTTTNQIEPFTRPIRKILYCSFVSFSNFQFSARQNSANAGQFPVHIFLFTACHERKKRKTLDSCWHVATNRGRASSWTLLIGTPRLLLC